MMKQFGLKRLVVTMSILLIGSGSALAEPGPFENFFRQFGFEDTPNGMQDRQFGQNRQFRMPQTPQMPKSAG